MTFVFVFVFEYCSTVYMYHTFIRSYVDGHLGCFLAIVNSVAVNTAVCVSFWINVISRCGISGPRGNPTFSFLRARLTVLYRGCPGSHSHSQCRSIPFSAHLLQHLLFTDLLIFNWRIIALQCCVGFCHTSAWISPDGYTYVPFLLNLSLTSHPIPPPPLLDGLDFLTTAILTGVRWGTSWSFDLHFSDN